MDMRSLVSPNTTSAARPDTTLDIHFWACTGVCVYVWCVCVYVHVCVCMCTCRVCVCVRVVCVCVRTCGVCVCTYVWCVCVSCVRAYLNSQDLINGKTLVKVLEV